MLSAAQSQRIPPRQMCGMLVLSRKEGERIVVDGQITITLIEIRGKKARIGINAPRHIPVHRQEIHDLLLSETMNTPLAPDLGQAARTES